MVDDDFQGWPSWAAESVEVVDYDPRWAVRGVQERDLLQSLLAPWRTDDVEHIGSTAVPGLAAKPILDLQAPVVSLEVADAVAGTLALYGWHYVPPHLDRRPYRRFFVKVVEGRRAAHLHLMANDALRCRQQLSFRDALRGDSDLVRAYANLKTLLTEQHQYDREAYSSGKEQFIHRVLNRPPDGK